MAGRIFTIRSLLIHTAIFAAGLAIGLYWSRGPAWIVYYQQGYRDGMEAGRMPLGWLYEENEALRRELKEIHDRGAEPDQAPDQGQAPAQAPAETPGSPDSAAPPRP